MKLTVVLLGLVFWHSLSLAQTRDHLVYRCEDLHWECVSKAEYKLCREARNEDILKNLKSLSCAEFDQFPSVRGCEQRILYLTTHNFGTRFCLHPAIKEDELLY